MPGDRKNAAESRRRIVHRLRLIDRDAAASISFGFHRAWLQFGRVASRHQPWVGFREFV
jgi:hypothetical protein